jgi:ABC-2 type transport system ATP-binding protein
MTTQAPLAIEATGLVKSFGETRAVDGVDLTVRSGTVYGVLGPNGAGKTTTIRMLATLLRPDAGSARVLGHDIVHDADAVRGLVSLTGQLASVDEDLSGHENLVLLACCSGSSAARRRRARPSCSPRSGSPRRPASSSSTTQAACGGASTSPRASSSRRS